MLADTTLCGDAAGGLGPPMGLLGGVYGHDDSVAAAASGGGGVAAAHQQQQQPQSNGYADGSAYMYGVGVGYSGDLDIAAAAGASPSQGAAAAAADNRSRLEKLKEKNRLAQRRFRARQKDMLEQMQARMDELHAQVCVCVFGV